MKVLEGYIYDEDRENLHNAFDITDARFDEVREEYEAARDAAVEYFVDMSDEEIQARSDAGGKLNPFTEIGERIDANGKEYNKAEMMFIHHWIISDIDSFVGVIQRKRREKSGDECDCPACQMRKSMKGEGGLAAMLGSSLGDLGIAPGGDDDMEATIRRIMGKHTKE